MCAKTKVARPMCVAIKCCTVCSLDIYIILMSCHCSVMFDLALTFVLVLTFKYLSLVLGLACQGNWC